MQSKNVLVTDFDGTITQHDFYKLAVERLLTPGSMRHWDEFRAGKISHFRALQLIFGEIKAPESKVLQVVKDMQIDPAFEEALVGFNQAGWHVAIASAGCAWYIEILLRSAGVAPGADIEVNASPGYYGEGGPLYFQEPLGSPFYSPETGIDKVAVVRFYQQQGCNVAYAGDSITDLKASLMVPPAVRFARAGSLLDEELSKAKEAFHKFDHWSEIARKLLEA